MSAGSALDAFLRGDRPDDVAIFVQESVVDDPGRLAEHGTRIGDGIVLVVDGRRGRNAFATMTGLDPMVFARRAMPTWGEIEPSLSGGTCPSCERTHVRFVFAFVQSRNEEAGGLYAEGDVIHAYALCSCDTAFSNRWLADDD